MNRFKIMAISFVTSVSIIAISTMVLMNKAEVNGLLVGAALYLGIECRVSRYFGGKK